MVVFVCDEYFKVSIVEVLVGLCLVFKKDGIVMVGNVSGLNDGVVVVVMVMVDVVVVVGLIFKFCVFGYVYVGVCFEVMGIGFVLVV